MELDLIYMYETKDGCEYFAIVVFCMGWHIGLCKWLRDPDHIRMAYHVTI